MQLYADIYLLLNYSTCFGRPSHPSSGVHKTVVATSGTDHTIWGASFFIRDQIRTGLGQWVWSTSLVWNSRCEVPHWFGTVGEKYFTGLGQSVWSTSLVWDSRSEVPHWFETVGEKYFTGLRQSVWSTSLVWDSRCEVLHWFGTVGEKHFTGLGQSVWSTSLVWDSRCEVLHTDCPKPVLIWSRLKKLASQIVWSVPEAATIVLCTPDDGCDGLAKHVE